MATAKQNRAAQRRIANQIKAGTYEPGNPGRAYQAAQARAGRPSTLTQDEIRRLARRRAAAYARRPPERRQKPFWPEDELAVFWDQFADGDSGILVDL